MWTFLLQIRSFFCYDIYNGISNKFNMRFFCYILILQRDYCASRHNRMLWQNWLTSIGWPHWFISRSIDFAANIGSIYLISSCARQTCDEKKIEIHRNKKCRIFLDQSKASSVCAHCTMTIWFSASPIRYHFSWHATKELTAWIYYVQTSLIRNHFEKKTNRNSIFFTN